MPSKKKKYNARFPPARIKKIMQTDEEVGKVAATVPVIISRALELFIESLIVQASQTTLSKKARTLSASHLKQTIQSEKKYDFLHELVANIPDHQTEEDGDCTSVIENQDKSNQSAVKRPRGRPRKPRDPSGAVQKKERKRKQAKMESSEDSDSDASEETDDAVEDSEGEGEASCSANNFSSIPSTSSGMLLMPPPTPSVPPVPLYSGMTVVPPVSWSLQAPGPVGFSQMPVPVMRAGLRTAEDDDYDT